MVDDGRPGVPVFAGHGRLHPVGVQRSQQRCPHTARLERRQRREKRGRLSDRRVQGWPQRQVVEPDRRRNQARVHTQSDRAAPFVADLCDPYLAIPLAGRLTIDKRPDDRLEASAEVGGHDRVEEDAGRVVAIEVDHLVDGHDRINGKERRLGVLREQGVRARRQQQARDADGSHVTDVELEERNTLQPRGRSPRARSAWCHPAARATP